MFTFLPKAVYNFIADHHLWGPFIIIFAVVALYLLFTLLRYLRFIKKRLKLIRRLRNAGEETILLKSLWKIFFAGNRSQKADFYIKGLDAVLSCKIITQTRFGTEMCFSDALHYRTQRYWLAGRTHISMISAGFGRIRNIKKCDFSVPEEKKIIPCYLFSPKPFRLTVGDGKTREKRYVYSAEDKVSNITPLSFMHGLLVLDGETLTLMMKSAQIGRPFDIEKSV